jgi:hypothetical protein
MNGKLITKKTRKDLINRETIIWRKEHGESWNLREFGADWRYEFIISGYDNLEEVEVEVLCFSIPELIEAFLYLSSQSYFCQIEKLGIVYSYQSSIK